MDLDKSFENKIEAAYKRAQRAKTEAEKLAAWEEIKDLQAQRKAKTGRGYGGK
jgi:ribosomal protein L17